MSDNVWMLQAAQYIHFLQSQSLRRRSVANSATELLNVANCSLSGANVSARVCADIDDGSSQSMWWREAACRFSHCSHQKIRRSIDRSLAMPQRSGVRWRGWQCQWAGDSMAIPSATCLSPQ
eukprot:6456051-Amphidinium_carterae.1